MIYQKFSKRQLLSMLWWQQPKLRGRDAIICDGSIRSGKTLTMSVGFILWAMCTFNGQKFAICGKTIESLRRNVIINLRDWLPYDLEITERRAENKLIISDGTGRENVFFLFGGKDESSYTLIQGMTLAGVLMDEVALMPRSFVEQALARCSVAGSTFWFNCNPEGPQHWFYLEWICKTKEHNALHLHFTMDDNPALPPEIRKRYEAMYSGVFYRRYVRGEWCKAEGLVYSIFDKAKHVTSELPKYDRSQSKHFRYYISIDYGTLNPFSAGLWCLYDGVAYRMREFYHNGRTDGQKTDSEYYDAIEKLAGNLPIESIIIDPSAASMITEIMRRGKYTVVKARNDVLPGISYTAALLQAGRMKIGAACEDAIREFGLYAWEEKGETDRVIKENDHAMDDIRYFAYTILRRELFAEMRDYRDVQD